ncbi:MAG: ankyrin repeat domain-containing protein, partial [bacterium]
MKTYNERRKIKLTYFALMLGLLITTPPVFGDLTKQIDTFSISLKALKLKLVDLAGKIQTVKEKLTVPTKSKDEIFKDLYQACLRENLEALKQMAHLITPEIVNTKDGNSTPLETMVSMKAKNLDNRIAMINILIDKGAPVDTKDKSNRTLLHLIVSSKTNNLITNLAIIELLIKKGANVNAKENIQQDTPLHLACEEPNNEEIIKVLLAHKANPLIKNALNKTPIDIAKASGNPEYIALLISDEEIEKALN